MCVRTCRRYFRWISKNELQQILRFTQFIPFSAFVLMSVEVFEHKIKTYKYYHCVTLLIYELIWILSIFTYLYTLLNVWPIEWFVLKLLQEKSIEMILYLLFVIAYGIGLCIFWTQNTFTHMSLCRNKMFEVSKF